MPSPDPRGPSPATATATAPHDPDPSPGPAHRATSALPPGSGAPPHDVGRIATHLAAIGCVAPEAEAAEIAGAAPDGATVDAWLARRSEGEPLAWIVGSTSFGGRRISVHPGVYVPRPQTEELARRAAALLPARGRALDLCTGSGAIAAHLRAERPDASVVAVDVDPAAVRCARANGGSVLRADVRALPLPPHCLDLVTAVVPYVPTDDLRLLPRDVTRWEPRRALDGGADGLDLARATVQAAAHVLRPGGWLLLELGGDQASTVGGTLAAAGFGPADTWTDPDGDLRGLATQR